MSSMEDQIEAATASRDLPAVVLVASDVSGKFHYEKAIGPKNPTEKIGTDATFIMASCTKLMTSIAAMQCVERGQIGLDDDVTLVLKELKGVKILTGFKEGTEEPEFKTAENKITVRLLLSHSSGIAYQGRPQLLRWEATLGDKKPKRFDPMVERMEKLPLLFEPGTSWTYGYGLDWAGILVGRLNNMSLEAYMEKHIWTPLGIRDITFHQELKPSVREKLVKMSKRGEKAEFYGIGAPSEEKAVWTDEKLYQDPTVDEYGGAGAIGAATEYIKILKSICTDDGVLLTSETMEEMFTPQLNEDAQKAFQQHMGFLKEGGLFSSHGGDVEVNYGLGGALILSDKETGIKSGTMTWSGLPNLLWTIDKCHKFQQIFETEMYSRAAEAQRIK